MEITEKQSESLHNAVVASLDVTPLHPFTPDVVAWAEGKVRRRKAKQPGASERVLEGIFGVEYKAARQILAAVGREEPRFVRVPHIGEAS